MLEHPGPAPFPADGPLVVAPLSPTEARIDRLAAPTVPLYPPLPWALVGGVGLAVVTLTTGLVALAAASDLHPVLHACCAG